MSCASLASSARAGPRSPVRLGPYALGRPPRFPRAARRARRDRPRVFPFVLRARRQRPTRRLREARPRAHRAHGPPEASLWGPGKTPAQILQIMLALRDRQNAVMATRVPPLSPPSTPSAAVRRDARRAADTRGRELSGVRPGASRRRAAPVRAERRRAAKRRRNAFAFPRELDGFDREERRDLAVAQEAATTERAMGVDAFAPSPASA